MTGTCSERKTKIERKKQNHPGKLSPAHRHQTCSDPYLSNTRLLISHFSKS